MQYFEDSLSLIRLQTLKSESTYQYLSKFDIDEILRSIEIFDMLFSKQKRYFKSCAKRNNVYKLLNILKVDTHGSGILATE